jgi:hypothetical protein
LIRGHANQIACRRERPIPLNTHVFFYISSDRVAFLRESVGETERSSGIVDETVKDAMVNVALDPNAMSGFRRRAGELTELLKVLGACADIQNLTTPEPNRDIHAGWAYAELELRIVGEAHGLFILEGWVGSNTLKLSCSARNFAAYNETLGELAMTSTTQWFLNGQPYTFRTHVWLPAAPAASREIRGLPLYLALPIGVLPL